MDTQQLQAFIAISHYGSFSKAAEQLHLTQPAISKRISALEQQLQCQLFNRRGRNISLTEAGKLILPRANEILTNVEEAKRAVNDLNGRISGTLHIATSHHIGLHHLPPLLKRFREQYPDVQPQLSFMDSEHAYRAVEQGEVELALITLSPDAEDPFVTLPIWPDPLHFVVSTDHPLSHHAKIGLEQLSQYPALLPEASTHTTQLVQKLFEEQKLSLKMTMPTNFLETIKMMVSIGLGWSALPVTMIDEQLHRLTVSGNFRLRRQLGCIHHRHRRLGNAAQALIAQLKEP